MNKKFDKKKLPIYIFGACFIAFMLVFGGFAVLKMTYSTAKGEVEISTEAIADELSKNVAWKEDFLRINGNIQSIIGQKVSNGVAESDGYFAFSYDKINNAAQIADNIIALKEYTEEKGIPFVFVATPYKGEMSDFIYPVSVSDLSLIHI